MCYYGSNGEDHMDSITPRTVRQDRERWMRALVAHVADMYTQHNPFTPSDPSLLFDGPMPSNTDPTLIYTVTVDTHYAGTCTCLGFNTFNRGRDCSHITTVKGVLNT